MVQVGTAKFDATKFCNLTTVSLAGSPKKWNETFVGDFSAINKKEVLEYSSDLARYSDGYMLTMEITAGQEIEANAMMGTCIQAPTSSAICVQALAADDNGVLSKNGITAKFILASDYKTSGNK
jgi:hypothetical protein